MYQTDKGLLKPQPHLTREELAGARALGAWLHQGARKNARGELGFPPAVKASAATNDYWRKFSRRLFARLESIEAATRSAKTSAEYFERLLSHGTRLNRSAPPAAATNYIDSILAKDVPLYHLRALTAIYIRFEPGRVSKPADLE